MLDSPFPMPNCFVDMDTPTIREKHYTPMNQVVETPIVTINGSIQKPDLFAYPLLSIESPNLLWMVPVPGSFYNT